MDPNNHEAIFCMLVSSQNKSGWQHLLKGRFSKQWTQIEGRYILDDPDIDQEKQSHGNLWLKLIMHHPCWTHLWQLWLACNDNLYCHDKDEAKRMQRHRKATTTSPHIVVQTGSAASLQQTNLELPSQVRMKLHSRELVTWVPLFTPTVKRALTDTA